jgi:hypothetical protein
MIESLVGVAQPRKVDAHDLQDRGLEIAHVSALPDGLEPKPVNGADRLPHVDSCARRANGKTVPVVVATRFTHTLARGRTAELAVRSDLRMKNPPATASVPSPGKRSDGRSRAQGR